MPYQPNKLRQLLSHFTPEQLYFMLYDAPRLLPLYQRLKPGRSAEQLTAWLMAERGYHAPLLQAIKRNHPALYQQYAPYAENPFHSGGGYLHEAAAFYGRGQLLREVKGILQQYQNVAILSPQPLLGASSLLYHLWLTRAQWLPASTLVAYLDLNEVIDELNFFMTVADKLGFSQVNDYRAFQQMVRGREVILLLDEVELLTSWVSVQRVLRAFSQDQHHALAVISRFPLKELFPTRPDNMSPLSNVFLNNRKELFPFTDHEARDFLRQRLQDGDPTFSPAEIEQLIAASHGLPSELQRLAYQLFEAKNEGYSE